MINERLLVFVEWVFSLVYSDEQNFLSNNFNPIVKMSIKITNS